MNGILAGNSAELSRIPFGSNVEAVIEIMRRDGAVVLQGALTRDEIERINRDIDAFMPSSGGSTFGGAVAHVTGSPTATPDSSTKPVYTAERTRYVPHCIKRSSTYRERLVDSAILSDYLAALIPAGNLGLGLYASIAIEILPGELAQSLHRDGEGIFGRLGLYRAGGPCCMVTTLLAMGDITEDMGATRVIPGSQDWQDFSEPASPATHIPATLNAGDLLLYNGMTLHGGGANHSNLPRRVIATAFTLPFVMGEEAWPFVLEADEVRTYSTRVQQMVGFRSVSSRGEEPGFLWRVDSRPLEEHLEL